MLRPHSYLKPVDVAFGSQVLEAQIKPGDQQWVEFLSARLQEDRRIRQLGAGLVLELSTHSEHFHNRLAAVLQVDYSQTDEGLVECHVRYAPSYNLDSEEIGHYKLPTGLDTPPKHPVFIIGRNANLYCDNFGVTKGGNLCIGINSIQRESTPTTPPDDIPSIQAACHILTNEGNERVYRGPKDAKFSIENTDKDRICVVRAYYPDTFALR